MARQDGVHTAGSSSQIADGAAAVLVMSAERRRGSSAPGRWPGSSGTALVGCDPVLMLEGPIPATRKLLERAGLAVDDIDVFEVNEAFASVVLAWARSCGPDMERVNPNGGAISLGHPLGGTGCFLVTKAVHELQRTAGRYGLVSMCCGGGSAPARCSSGSDPRKARGCPGPSVSTVSSPAVGLRLADVDPGDTGAAPGGQGGDPRNATAAARPSGWPSCRSCSGRGAEHRVLLVLQGIDTAGKGGAVEHVLGAVNPARFPANGRSRRRHRASWPATTSGGVHANVPAGRRDRRLQP